MQLFDYLRSRWSPRSRAMWLYRRGMIKAKLHDQKSAIADYTAVIEMDDAPADVRAMALFNRSVVFSTNHDDTAATRDLEQLLQMAGASGNVRTEAQRKLVRMRRASERPEHGPITSE